MADTGGVMDWPGSGPRTPQRRLNVPDRLNQRDQNAGRLRPPQPGPGVEKKGEAQERDGEVHQHRVQFDRPVEPDAHGVASLGVQLRYG